MKCVLSILIGAFLIPLGQAPPGQITLESRVALIRAFASEFAVTKVALPRGKYGFFVKSDGKVEKEKNRAEFRLRGKAVNPGTPIHITKVRFKENRIIFEINGGGKSRKKWYQRIQVTTGTTASRALNNSESPGPAFGSYVNLVFEVGIPDLTVDEVKKMLNSVFDFERRSLTVLYSPWLPLKFKEAIQEHKVLVGMNRDAVLSSKGIPDRKVREVHEDVEYEDWIYGQPPINLFITFDGDVVIRVKKFGHPEQSDDATVDQSTAAPHLPNDPSIEPASLPEYPPSLDR